ncbi:hypothetical protein DYB32_006771 [Aphanomyces invadans]|uniref:Uncharacterized protein n=1 Tax=Aphanomyces invadans TaxID=157072 RepID=A0A418AQB6_9STRA|nr:hypothetical protein DYB32_006771 [Aphanomyces invadans]
MSQGGGLPQGVRTANVCVVDYATLAEGADCGAVIEAAFGPDGLGILAVSNVPDVENRRSRCLPLAYKVANLPNDVKQKYELPDAYYSFGWSHGKESLQGKPDFSKGSFYNNPRTNRPTDDENLMATFPTMYHLNIWPSGVQRVTSTSFLIHGVDEIPDLEPSFMSLGQLIIDTGLLVAKQCDVTAPLTSGEITEGDFSNWCGWHNDHSALTGLVQALYTDVNGNAIDNPDPAAGLYIKTRRGEIVKAVIPAGHLVFQIGESSQILTGGILKATPHAVRGPQVPGVNRETLAVFMSVEHDEPMCVPATMNPQEAGQTTHLPEGVPSLHSRWNNSMLFHEFTAHTHKAYYDMQHTRKP